MLIVTDTDFDTESSLGNRYHFCSTKWNEWQRRVLPFKHTRCSGLLLGFSSSSSGAVFILYLFCLNCVIRMCFRWWTCFKSIWLHIERVNRSGQARKLPTQFTPKYYTIWCQADRYDYPQSTQILGKLGPYIYFAFVWGLVIVLVDLLAS